MSETIKFSIDDVKNWLEHETKSVFIPVNSKAMKLRDELAKALGNLAEASRMLLDNSGKEIERRNMRVYGRARALNKLAHIFIDRIKQTQIPEQVTYDSLNLFAQDLQKTILATEIDIRNYFPRISPFFILDRRKFQNIFDKIKDLHKDLDNFLTKEYVKTKTLEETFRLIDEVKASNVQLTNISEQQKKVESKKASVEEEVAKTEQRIADLKSKGGISQLATLDTEIESLNAEVKSSFQHLQKPFIKLQSLATHGEGSGLTPEELNKLDQYIDNPFEAFAAEEANYPLLRQILPKLEHLMSEEKLKLKLEKVRKARQVIGNILNKGSLANLHQRCVDIKMKKTQLLTSNELAASKGDLLRLQTQMENLERRNININSEKTGLEKVYTETLEKIRNHKSQIEKNIFAFMNKRVRVE